MNKAKVLLVDDEPLMVKSTAMALTYRGFEVQGVTDPAYALARAKEWQPDIILLDVMMPVVDGWEILTRLKTDHALQSVPVVMFTAREYSNGKTLATQRGAAGYVAKPFELDDLIEVLNLHLGTRG